MNHPALRLLSITLLCCLGSAAPAFAVDPELLARGTFPTVQELHGNTDAVEPFIRQMLEAYPGSEGQSVLEAASRLEQLAGLPRGSFEAPEDAPDLSAFIPGFTAQPKPSVDELVASIHSPEDLQAVLSEMLATQLFATLGTGGGIDNWGELREVMPIALSGSDEIGSLFTDFEFWRTYLRDPDFGQPTLDAWRAKYADNPAPIYETLLGTSIYIHPQNRLGWLIFEDPRSWVRKLPAEAWPQDEPLSISILQGRITIGTPGDDHYTGAHEVLLDPGGNDTYEDCRLGSGLGLHDQRIGYFVDLGGNDRYECQGIDYTLGSGRFGKSN